MDREITKRVAFALVRWLVVAAMFFACGRQKAAGDLTIPGDGDGDGAGDLLMTADDDTGTAPVGPGLAPFTDDGSSPTSGTDEASTDPNSADPFPFPGIDSGAGGGSFSGDQAFGPLGLPNGLSLQMILSLWAKKFAGLTRPAEDLPDPVQQFVQDLLCQSSASDSDEYYLLTSYAIDILGRLLDPTTLAEYSSIVPTSETSRKAIARKMLRSSDGAANLALIYFVSLLGRVPTQSQLGVLRSSIARDGSIENAIVRIMTDRRLGFRTRAATRSRRRAADQQFIDAVLMSVTRHSARSAHLSYYENRRRRLGDAGFVREILRAPKAALISIYFTTALYLHRAPTTAELTDFLSRMTSGQLDRLGLQAEILGDSEYDRTAKARFAAVEGERCP